MFIDIHGHVHGDSGVLRGGKPAFCTPEQLVARHDAVGIEQGVLLPLVSPECNYLTQSNDEVLAMAAQCPGRFIPFCNIDPRMMGDGPGADLGYLLGYYRDKGCQGVGEVVANIPFDDPRMMNLFKHTQAAGLPLTFHVAHRIGGIYGIYDDPGLPRFEAAVRAFPKLKFLCHSQSFWAEMGRLRTPLDRSGYPNYPIEEEGVVPQFFRRYENVYGDLSAGSGCNALKRDQDYAVQFLNEFQDRLLFGTDICAPDTPTPLVDFLFELRSDGRITEEVFQKVARENAIKLLDL